MKLLNLSCPVLPRLDRLGFLPSSHLPRLRLHINLLAWPHYDHS